MTPLRRALADYLAMRRALGYRLARAEKLLAQFLAYLEDRGETCLRTETALAWATLPTGTDPSWWASRLTLVRGFATYLHTIDPATQVPPVDLLRAHPRRATPYLYTDEDVAALLAAASGLRTTHRVATYRTLIGLLVVTGMRVGEAIALDLRDFDAEQGLITVRQGKLGKSRALPCIPAAAGRMTSRFCSRPLLCVQPRACGAEARGRWVEAAILGSFPRAGRGAGSSSVRRLNAVHSRASRAEFLPRLLHRVSGRSRPLCRATSLCRSRRFVLSSPRFVNPHEQRLVALDSSPCSASSSAQPPAYRPGVGSVRRRGERMDPCWSPPPSSLVASAVGHGSFCLGPRPQERLEHEPCPPSVRLSAPRRLVQVRRGDCQTAEARQRRAVQLHLAVHAGGERKQRAGSLRPVAPFAGPGQVEPPVAAAVAPRDDVIRLAAGSAAVAARVLLERFSPPEQVSVELVADGWVQRRASPLRQPLLVSVYVKPQVILALRAGFVCLRTCPGFLFLAEASNLARSLVPFCPWNRSVSGG